MILGYKDRMEHHTWEVVKEMTRQKWSKSLISRPTVLNESIFEQKKLERLQNVKNYQQFLRKGEMYGDLALENVHELFRWQLIK